MKKKVTKKKATTKARTLTTDDIPKIIDAVVAKLAADRQTKLMRLMELERKPDSKDELQEVENKIVRGIDLTPIEYKMPSPKSYFGRDESDNPLFPGFRETFIKHVKNGMSQADAYERTCSDFAFDAGTRRQSTLDFHFSIPDARTLFEE